ncbi:hypothetical protein [Parapedobacter indicus]|uniref:DUF4468 domain-containing protein n=1 Tax=Parapedobacter indicus TaxID=1477437 RepID=A0A1I3DZP6_9SPHI|nr:hypothetical protein [Parapedobacter indicus]PPL04908.1 hypothetical protein CLV26_101718 [Parapedobacter indicus]SFH92165.1 hypothetical protein SAMN05444682_101704 [Parapedobacter indicus]
MIKIASQLFLLVLASATVCVAQQKGDRRIYLSTDKPADSNYREFGRLLIKNGFDIRVRDDMFLKLGTEPKKYYYTTGRIEYYKYIMVDLIFVDNNIIAEMKFKPKGSRWNPVIYDKKKPWMVEAFKVVTVLMEEYGGELGFSNMKK